LETLRRHLLGGNQRAAALLVSAEDRRGGRAAIDHFLAALGPPDAVIDRIAAGRWTMCGIAGIFQLGMPKPVDPARVKGMIDAIAHRGPDGEGIWTAPGVGLGHRRLSIIDLSTGDQPMFSADGRQVVVFNGEIYNYRELRADMEAWGAEFRTHSD